MSFTDFDPTSPITFADMLAWVNDAIEDADGDDRAGDAISKLLEFMYDQPITFSNLLLSAFLAATPETDMQDIVETALRYADACDEERIADTVHRDLVHSAVHANPELSRCPMCEAEGEV